MSNKLKKKPVMTYRDDLQERMRIKRVMDEIRLEQMNMDMHYYTGLFYTTLAYVLRSKPYYWSADKCMRLMGQIQGIMADLDSNKIHVSDLVTAGEKKGVKVLWNSDRKWITDICVFEEKKDD